MLRIARLSLLVGAGLLLAAEPAWADDTIGASPPSSIDELLRRIRELEEKDGRWQRELEHQQQEIDELRQQVGDNWLTERRAEEIRNLVSDVLADADTRSTLMQDGMTAGWSEQFFLASGDGRFKLQVSGLQQFRYIWNFHDQADKYRGGFENTRTKITLRGHVISRDLTYLIRGNFSRNGGNFGLEDAWLRYHLTNEWNVRFGQFKLPFNREELVSPAKQLAVERSLVNESLNLGRSQGIEFAYADEANRLSLAFSDAGQDQVGGFNLVGTSGLNSPAFAEDTEFAFTTRYEYLAAGNWGQFDDFTSPVDEEFGLLLGIGAHYQQDEFTGGFSFGRNEERWFAGTFDVSAEWGGANAFASFSYHYIDDPSFGAVNVYGVVGQAGVYLTPKFELFTRFEWGTFNISVADFHDLYLITFGGNYYFDGHDIKLSADIGVGLYAVESPWDSDLAGWRIDGNSAEPQVVIRTQFQLLF